MATRASGFSLVEAVMVMFIIVVLGSIAVPRYSQFVSNQQIEAASRRVIADLAYAQRQARQSSASRTVSFNVAQSEYTLAGVAHLDHPSQPYVVRLSEEPFRAKIVSASFGGDANVTFTGYGTPDSGGSLVIAVGSRQATITLDAGVGQSKKSGISMIQLD
jgi:type II secretory pathway pseudopilin PulG